MSRIVLCLIILLAVTSNLAHAETNDIWLKAQEGDAESQATVGMWYLHGRADKEQSCDQAKEWFLKSARQGYEGAAVWLFSMYSGASASCEENKEQAKDWLMFAAGSGNVNYQWTLGQAYRDGWYEQPDIDKAIFWFQRSAQQGHGFAKRDLEKLSHHKRFTREDLEAEPAIIDDTVGALYRVKEADTSPLLYSPKLDMMVNPDCPTESMEGTIRNQIGFDCNGAKALQIDQSIMLEATESANESLKEYVINWLQYNEKPKTPLQKVQERNFAEEQERKAHKPSDATIIMRAIGAIVAGGFVLAFFWVAMRIAIHTLFYALDKIAGIKNVRNQTDVVSRVIKEKKTPMDDNENKVGLSFIQDAIDTIQNLGNFSSYPLLRKAYAVMLLLCVTALLPMPYEFYISLRMLICIGIAIFLYALSQGNQENIGHYKYMLLALIVLYNPLFVIHLGSKLAWAAVNLTTLYILFSIRGKINR